MRFPAGRSSTDRPDSGSISWVAVCALLVICSGGILLSQPAGTAALSQPLAFASETAPVQSQRQTVPLSPKEKAWIILQDGLAETNTDNRAAATHALGLIPNDGRAVSSAEKALADAKPEVRAAAAAALGEMGAKGSIAKLKKALQDEDVTVAIAAGHALITLGDPIGYDVYFAILTGRRKSGSSLIDKQLKILRNPKKLAWFGLRKGIGYVPFASIGYDAFQALTRNDASPVRAAAATMLAADPDPHSAEALVRASFDKSWMVRAAALRAVAMRNDASLIPRIEPQIFDDKAVVRYTGAAAVIRLAELHQSLPAPK